MTATRRGAVRANRDTLSKIYLILAAVGIVVASYDAYDYLTSNFNSCNFSKEFSCLGVFQSGHTSLFGVPFWLMGLIWFPLALILGMFAVERYEAVTRLNANLILPFLMIGNLFTIYLWFLELGVIHAICPVCLSLYLVNYTMTGVAAAELLL